MSVSKADIIARLQKEILPLQGYKPAAGNRVFDAGLGPIVRAFPNGSFPLGAVHEFFCSNVEDRSATAGFVSGIISALLGKTGALLWISPSKPIFPPALHTFGIQPDKVIFVEIPNEKERTWALEEALKCDGLSAVVGELQEITFTASRRLQLAVEQSNVTCFLIRKNPKNLATACVSRWKISSLPCLASEGLPGLGFPRWNVELVKVRNGKPGIWEVEWAGGSFQHRYKLATIDTVVQRKAG